MLPDAMLWGWKMVNGKLAPRWTTIEEVSKVLSELKELKMQKKNGHQQDINARGLICYAQNQLCS